MKRQPAQTESLVYSYGCRKALISGLEHAIAEAERQRALWDRLVDIDRNAERAQMNAAAADVPDIAATVVEIDRVTAELRADGLSKTGVKALVRERDALRRSLWAPMAEWRKGHADECRRIEKERRDAVTNARQATDCYWGNYNRVIADYERSRLTVRQFGRRLRYAQEGAKSGCLTVQIQRTKTGLGAAPRELMDGSFSALSIGMVDPRAHDPHTFRGERDRLCRTEVEMRVDADGNMIRLPISFHRPLPDDARVKSAQLVWRQQGGKTRYSLCLTISRPQTTRLPLSGGNVHLRLGYDLTSSGALAVAEGDRSLQLDSEWMTAMDRVEALQSSIDDGWKLVAGQLVIDARCGPAEYAEIVLTRKQAGLRISPEVSEWYQAYRRQSNEMHGLRSKLIGRRREIYRLFARDLCRSCAALDVQTPILAAVAQAERYLPTNSLRQRAALSVLVMEIKHQAAKYGVAVRVASAPVPLDVDPKKIRKISRRQRAEIESARTARATASSALA